MIYTRQILRDRVIFEGTITMATLMHNLNIPSNERDTVFNMLESLVETKELMLVLNNRGFVSYSKGTNLNQDLLQS